MSSHLNRRDFLSTTLAAAATVTLSGTKSSGHVLGSNDRIRVAVAGLNGRGRAHISAYAGMKGVEIAYLVDPDRRTWNGALKQVYEAGGGKPQTVTDIRTALADKSVNAISIATPNHWHSLMTIWACEAGKDVYVEKPCSHVVHEGRVAVQAARKYGVLVQHGTQSRSDSKIAAVIAAIHSGKLGKLLISRGLCYKKRDSIGVRKPEPTPKELDFNLWTGPAPLGPFHTNLVHYNWHWFWDFGNGDLGNQGVHQMDIARWAIPGATLPKTVFSVGGRLGYKDQGETPNTQLVFLDFGNTTLIFEVRGLIKNKQENRIGNEFVLEAGKIIGTQFYPNGSNKPAPLPKVDVKINPGSHFFNFINAVRSRKKEHLNADILEGHYSSALCHLGNISYRLGSDVPFSPRAKTPEYRDLTETLTRMEDHLREKGVKLEASTYRLGKKLSFDAQSEKFTDDKAADALLSRKPRKPFVVPEKMV